MTLDFRNVGARVAVVGASGWIGRRLTQELVSAGLDVRAIARQGPPAEWVPAASWTTIGRRTTETELVQRLAGSSVVINAAGSAHLPYSHSASSTAVWANRDLPRVVASAASMAGVGRLVHLSSIKAAAELSTSPVVAGGAEEPKTAYGKSKLEGEIELRAVASRIGLEVVIVRPALVYGPGATANFRRLAQAAGGRLPVPLPYPYPTRSIMYIDNLVSLLVHLGHTSSNPSLIHAADVPHLTTRQLIVRLQKAVGRPPAVLPVPKAAVRALGRASGKSSAVLPLLASLVVEPTPVPGWTVPFPDHEGLGLAMRSGL